MCRWVSIALTTVLVRAATIPLLVYQFKAERRFNVTNSLQ
jgi:membrane protein insertase Oxa1/YidC/SpoIIIJ